MKKALLALGVVGGLIGLGYYLAIKDTDWEDEYEDDECNCPSESIKKPFYMKGRKYCSPSLHQEDCDCGCNETYPTKHAEKIEKELEEVFDKAEDTVKDSTTKIKKEVTEKAKDVKDKVVDVAKEVTE